jgi:hypothetical protein
MTKGDGKSETLDTALQGMQAALRKGNYSDLPDIVAVIEEQVAQMAPMPEAEALELQALATRNSALLRAALRGMRAAQRRVAEIASAASGLQTYDSLGKPHRLSTVQSSFKQRC